MGIQMMRFTQLNQTFQQVALAIDVADRAVRMQFGFADFDRELASFGEQRQ